MLRLFTISIVAATMSFTAMGQIQGNESNGTTAFNSIKERNIDLYPNPAVEYLVVELKNEDLRNAKFTMRSLIGTSMNIRVENIGFGKYRIPVKDFARGYYFLIVRDEDARFKKAYKFLKN